MKKNLLIMLCVLLSASAVFCGEKQKTPTSKTPHVLKIRLMRCSSPNSVLQTNIAALQRQVATLEREQQNHSNGFSRSVNENASGKTGANNDAAIKEGMDAIEQLRKNQRLMAGLIGQRLQEHDGSIELHLGALKALVLKVEKLETKEVPGLKQKKEEPEINRSIFTLLPVFTALALVGTIDDEFVQEDIVPITRPVAFTGLAYLSLQNIFSSKKPLPIINNTLNGIVGGLAVGGGALLYASAQPELENETRVWAVCGGVTALWAAHRLSQCIPKK